MKIHNSPKTGRRLSVSSRIAKRTVSYRPFAGAGMGFVEMDGIRYKILNSEVYRAYRLMEKNIKSQLS